jgi:hypothetical protein
MSENTNNENITPATLESGEAVIPKEYVENNKDAINELVEKYKESVKDLPKPKEAKEADEESLIISPKPAEEKPALGFVENGVMGSTTVLAAAKKPAPEPKKKDKKDIVAVYSTRNVTWSGVGKVYIGYNIVSKEAAEKWSTRDHIRIATPEEVATEYGV